MAGGDGTPAIARSLEVYPLAKCLDGTPARYYIRRADPFRMLIFFEGWGFCSSMSQCQARSMTFKGSTRDDPLTLQLDRPYFRRDSSNPLLGSFTHVFVRTCDGGYFSGSRREPISYNGSMLHFNGRWIVDALLTDLAAYASLRISTTIVLGGCSAGGINVLAHLDFLRERLPRTAQVVGFVDSGFYMNLPIYSRLKSFVLSPSGMNASWMLSHACVAEHPKKTEACLVGQVSSMYLHTPTFLWQSVFDTDQQDCELSPVCAESIPCRAEYGANLSAAIRSWLLANTHIRHGAFLDMCSRHCDDGMPPPLQMGAILAEGGISPLQAFAAWHRGLTSRTLWTQEGVPAGKPVTCTVSFGLPTPNSSGAITNVFATLCALSATLAVAVAMVWSRRWWRAHVRGKAEAGQNLVLASFDEQG